MRQPLFLVNASIVALSFGAAPAYGQVVGTAETIETDAQACAALPTQAERERCLEALNQDEDEVVRDADGSPAEAETIVVTGSRIRVAAAESREPIVVLDEEYIEERNLTNVADALNELPIYSGSVTPAGSQGTFGQGVNFLNTFGLGSNRNLTLINGRRFVTSNPPTVFNNSAAGTQVDLNVIPTILVDRVETIAVGGAPVYGSDAIASTTNVIIKSRFEGMQFSATSGITERGDNFRFNVSGVAGFNFFDDRLNVTASISRDEVDGLVNNDRDFLRQGILNRPNNVPEGGLADQNRVNPNFGNDTGPNDNIPPFVRFRNGTIPFLSRGGVIFGGPLSLRRQFDRSGNLVPFDRGASVGSIFAVGGEGFRFSDFSQVTSDLERTSGNLFLTFEVFDGIEAYAEGTYFKSRADELVQQPTFNTVLFGGSSGALFFRADNPFLTDQARAELANARVTQFRLSRASTDLADLTGFGENEIYRGVVGFRGEFGALGRVFNFDASYNRGDAEVTTFRQDINRQNFINAVNVTRNAAGQIVCTTARTRAGGNGFAAPGGTPVADPNCVPLNLFGEGVASQAAIDYVVQDTTAVATLDQEVFNFNIGSTLFDLWGAGPIGFNVGYEHRTERGAFIPDEFTEEGLGRAVAIAPVSGSYNLDEVFGEALLPLVSPRNNIPVIYEAEVFGRARYVHNTVNGGFLSWAAGGRIAPVRDLTIRGNFTRSFRAPAISELFSPQSNAFGFIGQPCENPAAQPNPEVTAQNCAAFLGRFPNANEDPSQNASIPILLGGNLNLENEEADAYTIGAVLQPRFLPRFVFAVDYVNIKINQPIVFLGTADLVRACFSNQNFNTADPANGNRFCSQIRRQPAGTLGPDPRGPNPANPSGGPIDIGGFVINDPVNPGVTTGFTNGVRLKFEALQAVMSYTLPNIFGTEGSLSASGNALYVLRRVTDNTGVTPIRSDGTFGDPTFAAQLNLRYFTDDWGALWSTNFVGRQLATRDERSLDLREINRRSPYALFNASVYFDPSEDMRFTLSVTNVFDRNFQNSYFGSPNGIADDLGRRFAASARVRF